VTKPEHAWMVRAGDNNELAEMVEEKGAPAQGLGPGRVSET
jgi:hypothetical protein